MADEGGFREVYRDKEGTSTEWEDIHRRLGNFPEAPPVFKPEPFTPAPDTVPVAGKLLLSTTADEVEDLGDAPEVSDDRTLSALREARLQELRAEGAPPRFGTLIELTTREEFVPEVTLPSAAAPVVCLLFRPLCDRCADLRKCLDELARKHPLAKFCAIPVALAVGEGYPDAKIPTLLVYAAQDVAASFFGLDPYGGKKLTPETVQAVLEGAGAFAAERAHAEAALAERRTTIERTESDEDSDLD
mmetsp:Transcript_18345/g.59727  ORF Transcript_18345/g.59727 Transcript_18345/m.59727 type:complete len:246 (+) Transcript_18345:31-768(+)